MATVQDGGEGGEKDGGKGTGAGDILQGNNEVSVVIWQQELGGDGFNDKSTRVILSQVRQTDCGDDGAAYDERRKGVEIGE